MEDKQNPTPTNEAENSTFRKIEKQQTHPAGAWRKPTNRMQQRVTGTNGDIPSPSLSVPVTQKPIFVESVEIEKRIIESRRVKKSRRIMWAALTVATATTFSTVGLGCYISFLNGKIDRLREERDSFAENLAMAPASEELVRPQTISSDEVQGRLILHDSNDEWRLMPIVAVKVFHRKDVEQFLEETATAIMEDAQNESGLRKCMNSLPKPVAITISNLSGAFNAKLPEPGDYVIASEVVAQDTGKYFAWLIGFDSRDAAHAPIELSFANSVKNYDPLTMLREAR